MVGHGELPTYFQAIVYATLAVAALSLFAGFALSTYVKAVATAVVLVLGWIAVVTVLDLPLDAELGAKLGIAIGIILIAVAAHTLRRLAGAANQHLRKS